MARRSARLASSSSKPPSQSPAEPSLSSVAERDDSPQDGAQQSMNAILSSPPPVPKTPRDSSPIKPPMSEMHPSRAHPSMAPPSSGLRLGFTDIKPSANRNSKLPAAVQTTPSKVAVPSSDFTFTFARQAATDMRLGPDAQRMMDELREQATAIKAELAAKREMERAEEEQVNGRKFARPKGKAGRFSAVHMAEFKKMDSIENHPSAFRAQSGRNTPTKPSTPLKAGVKRSQSRANLDEPDSVRKQHTPASTMASAMRIKAPAFKEAFKEPPPSVAKRARQHMDDDASSNRPISRDATSLPRPKSAGIGSAIPRSKPSLASLMTPTKSSLARTTSVKTPVHSLIKSPSKSTLSGIPRSAAPTAAPTIKLVMEKEPEATLVEVNSPAVKTPTSRFDRVKSMFRGNKSTPAKAKSTLPLPSAFGSKTPASAQSERKILPIPMSTPGRKLTKRVAFTPETHRAAVAQGSPSPIKSSIPRSNSRKVLGEVYYPTLDSVMTEESAEDAVSYPDLSSRRPLPVPPIKVPTKLGSPHPETASTFTFRSDHTIKFNDASPSFGSSPGQASMRPVRPSILPTETMPGSFPDSISILSPNKENMEPRTYFPSLPHGIANKKRHRPSTDEEDAETQAAERAAKKRRQEMVPEGDALLAPRLTGASGKRPIATPKKPLSTATPSPKKRAGISLSRLNMLSRPKMRK